MESAHLHNHHLHHQHHQQSFQDSPPPPPSSSSPSSSYGVSTSSTAQYSWTPNTTLLSGGAGGGGLSSLYANGVAAAGSILSSRNHHHQVSVCNAPMAQDLSFHHWANAAAAGFGGGGGGSGQTIKQELSSPDCYPRLADNMNTLDAKLLLGTLSGGGHQPAAAAHQFYCSSTASSNTNTNTNRGRFSQIYPTISVPSLNQEASSSLANSSSLGMNLQALDLFNSATINGGFVHTSPDDHQHLGFHNFASFDHHHLQQSSQRPFPSNVSSPSLFSHATVAISADPKRPCNLVEPNPPQAPPKKSRLDSRASCPPFKVRKEKLGDRIAALQQLVAPFGKTDTASVLMEAIGYIKFLQNQVETLSVPYMKLSRNKNSGRAMQGVNVCDIIYGQEEIINIGSEEARRGLRSRGLCLVPLSCLSYVTDSGGGVWPPPPSLEHFSPIQ
ncbi:PREDICTED: transcription factor bHLH110-like isoform X2 [Ipomoea nil]|uniref:transcription factor bHLH110-like isoform X2 n=1 Tax=Ipomoea nil TaxID=35883 RepID=UPI0009018B82|nr:PREDICTED: transcription factor bHLH110-like isoform X2 [Ipomoea nil]